jgi:DNA-3-methyladenine glycosylase
MVADPSSAPGAVLERTFFERPAEEVAPDLLGKWLVRRRGRTTVAYRVTEAEAYIGPEDLACHAARGRTKRTEVMFGPAGVFYVYFIYGMYWMLNVITREEGFPAGVLIRGVETLSGPGRLTRALDITGTLNGRPATRSSGLWFSDTGERIDGRRIVSTPRIGIDYAGPIWASCPLRFVLQPEHQ